MVAPLLERTVRLFAYIVPVLALAACGTASPNSTDTGGNDTVDTGDTQDTSDTADTTDTGKDTSDTSTDTSDTSVDTSDTATDTSSTDPNDVDDDKDGYTENGGDCDDTKPRVNPDAPERCGDAIDNNCDGQVDEDCLSGDTGTAPVEWHLRVTTSGDTKWGLGAYDEHGSLAWLCESYAAFSATGTGDCADCDWSFDVAPAGGTTEGDYCDSMYVPGTGKAATFFDYEYSYFGVLATSYDGFGFAATYYSSYSYQNWEDVAFLHSATYDSWFGFVHNYPGDGTYEVTTDAYGFEGRRYAAGSSGYIYYYFPL